MAAVAIKVEAPAIPLISISEIARRVKLDKATVRSRLEDLGYEPDESSTEKLKLFPFDGEMKFAILAAKDTLTAAKIRNTRADYQLKELKLAQQRGELVAMAEATELVQKIIGQVYQEFVIRRPKRVDGKLAREKRVASIRQILKADADRVMKQLRDNFEGFIE